MPARPAIARIWRGRTRRQMADEYEADLRREGIPPLEKSALGVQLFREDCEGVTEFVTTSYWADVEAMSSSTGGDPSQVHHLPRDETFLIELPERVQVMRVLIDLSPNS